MVRPRLDRARAGAEKRAGRAGQCRPCDRLERPVELETMMGAVRSLGIDEDLQRPRARMSRHPGAAHHPSFGKAEQPLLYRGPHALQ
jgi:hypothetical protein